MTETQTIILIAAVVLLIWAIWVTVQIIRWAKKRKNGGRDNDEQKRK